MVNADRIDSLNAMNLAVTDILKQRWSYSGLR